MSKMLIFGPGYTATRLAVRLRTRGWTVVTAARSSRSNTLPSDTLRFDDFSAVCAALRGCSHILSSVPPSSVPPSSVPPSSVPPSSVPPSSVPPSSVPPSSVPPSSVPPSSVPPSSVPPGGASDPVLRRYGEAIANAKASWIGYLSSTGVYGDTRGAWVDETAPIKGRRGNRNAADRAWLALSSKARIFRLPGIYGPARSAFERIAKGRAQRIDLPDQLFSRIHVDDIVGGIIASFTGPAGVYNLADDYPCDQNQVIDYACRLMGVVPPALRALDEARLSPSARAFYSENRRVANGKAKRLLGWRLVFPTYVEGLSNCFIAYPQNAPSRV